MRQNHWVVGSVRSGKTQAIVDFTRQWCQDSAIELLPGQSILLFAMNSDNRQQVTQRILAATQGDIPIRSTTPLGFFEDEVKLFWPLIAAELGCNVAMPIRLRPESEQYLAVQFWGEAQLKPFNDIEPFSLWRWARNLLDVIQLAAFAGVPLEKISKRLKQRLDFSATDDLWLLMEEMLRQWQRWCLNHGFVTYGLASDLYWRCLLPLAEYQLQLKARYAYVIADDVENYPAIAGQLFKQLYTQGIDGFYTYNPDFSVRLGLGADPDYMNSLKDVFKCKVTSLPSRQTEFNQALFLQVSTQRVLQDIEIAGIEKIETVTRSQLLRQTAQSVINLVQSGAAQPHEIAIIGPGLDSLARYALIEIIEAQSIPVLSWKEQRPLTSSALVRSLMTLLTFIYDGLGRFCRQEDVAEMIMTLCQIDPVRAGLLADHCFQPDSIMPSLTGVSSYPRWDRIGSHSAKAFMQLQQWIETHQAKSLSLTLVDYLSQSIATFFSQRILRFDENTILRELLETAQHFQEINDVFKSTINDVDFELLKALIEVVQDGTMTANPYPTASDSTGVILATAYQYRITHLFHHYHFWLDMTSPLWKQGSLTHLWGAEAFLSPPIIDINEEEAAIALMLDLSSRVSKKVRLCQSDLSTTGQVYLR